MLPPNAIPSRRLAVLLFGAALVLAACTPAQPSPTAPPSKSVGTTEQPAAKPRQQLGGTVSVLATWGGEEQESFLAMVEPFEAQTGVRVEYEGTRDLNAVLTTRVQGGNPPDVAGLPGPGPMAGFARQGK